MTLKEWIKKNVSVSRSVMGGEPVFAGTRVTIRRVALLAKQWATYGYMFEEYPFLTTEDIRYAVQFYNQQLKHAS